MSSLAEVGTWRPGPLPHVLSEWGSFRQTLKGLPPRAAVLPSREPAATLITSYAPVREMTSKLLSASLCLSSFVCHAQHAAPQFTLDDMAITVEKFDSLNKDQNRYNQDNEIYTVGKRFTFSYAYRDPAGCPLQLAKVDTVSQNGVAWRLVPAEQRTDQAVSHIVLSVVPGLSPFIEVFPDYNQTVILCDFKLVGGGSWTNEITGVIENQKNLWLYPPRTGLFSILELVHQAASTCGGQLDVEARVWRPLGR